MPARHGRCGVLEAVGQGSDGPYGAGADADDASCLGFSALAAAAMASDMRRGEALARLASLADEPVMAACMPASRG